VKCLQDYPKTKKQKELFTWNQKEEVKGREITFELLWFVFVVISEITFEYGTLY